MTQAGSVRRHRIDDTGPRLAWPFGPVDGDRPKRQTGWPRSIRCQPVDNSSWPVAGTEPAAAPSLSPRGSSDRWSTWSTGWWTSWLLEVFRLGDFFLAFRFLVDFLAAFLAACFLGDFLAACLAAFLFLPLRMTPSLRSARVTVVVFPVGATERGETSSLRTSVRHARRFSWFARTLFQDGSRFKSSRIGRKTIHAEAKCDLDSRTWLRRHRALTRSPTVRAAPSGRSKAWHCRGRAGV